MSLSLKLLAAIVIPLLIQVSFFGWYAYLLAQCEKLNEAEAHSTAVVGHINWLSTQLSLKAVAALQYAVTGDKEFLTMGAECRKQVDSEIKEVERLYAGVPADKKNVEAISDVAASLSTVCDNVLALKGSEREDMSSLQCPTVKERWQKFLKARDNLLTSEQARQNAITSKLPEKRRELEQLTLLGVAVNLVIAVTLMQILGSGIVRRIKVLTMNSKLLAEGKPLSGTVKECNDEITVLDKAFRSMAHDLDEAMEREALQARTDHLTGLSNRRAFYETLDHFVALGRRTNGPISLLICDIDHFKTINDRFGHCVGDEAIVAVADAIRSIVRKSDFAARWGGEEFILGMPNTDEVGAATLGERLRIAVSSISLPTKAGEIHFTASIGLAVFTEAHEDIEECIQRADGALYRAKNLGRDRVRIAELDTTLRMSKMTPPA